MQTNAAQLAAAVAALINALVASKFSTTGVMGMMNSVSYARWGLEGGQRDRPLALLLGIHKVDFM
jgi:hypothetical protein